MKTGTFRQRNNHSLLSQILRHLKVERGPDDRGEHIAWCCFHPDGQGKPPHRPNLNVSVRGYYCHACKKGGPLTELAKHLGINIAPSEDGFEATYDYRDKDGHFLYQVVRLPGKDFPCRRPDGKLGWIWNMKGVRWVPYRLPELIASPDKMVFIVEGEKDTDRLHEEGLLATTNPGGALKWRSEYSRLLKDRDVAIIPDNDEPGRNHAEKVAKSLHGAAKTVKMVELPGLEEHGDVSDWLDSGHTTKELLAMVENAAEWEPSVDEANARQSGERDSEKKETQAACLVRLVLESGAELFHDERENPYVAIPVPGGRPNISLDSGAFKHWSARLVYEATGKVPGREALAAARQVLAGKACFDGPEHRLHVRCARHNAGIWIDMDGCRAIEVEPGRWRIVTMPPVLFRSFPHQQALPEPVCGGDPWKVLRYLNLNDEGAKLLMMGYLVAAIVPDILIPVLALYGPPDTAKSTMLKIVKRLLDPTVPLLIGRLRSIDEFPQHASQNRVLTFDNRTNLSDDFSDALCGSVTGEGFAKRRLYTDEDSVVGQFRNVIGIAGVNLVPVKSDLLDRSIIVGLDSIPREKYINEEEFWRRFDEDCPLILGGLLDTLAAAMEICRDIDVGLPRRFGDFVRYGATAIKILGRDPSDFVAAFKRNRSYRDDAVIEANPVAQAVVKFMVDKTDWQGPATELLRLLKSVAEKLGIDIRQTAWPKGANKLSGELAYVQKALVSRGIVFERCHTSRARLITLRKIEQGAPAKAKKKARE